MQFFATVPLKKPDEWAASVGEAKFVPGKSAHTLAYAWHRARGFPASVATALEPLELEPKRGYIEWRQFLDTDTAPSTTDIMIDAEDANGNPVVIAVEGKCIEPFGERICNWVLTKGDPQRPGPRSRASTKQERLKFLNDTLGTAIGSDSQIFYQLVHRTASVVLRAQTIDARQAVVLVHAFVPPGKRDPNFDAWNEFLAEIGIQPTQRGSLAGPKLLGISHQVEVYFAWVEDAPHDTAR